MKQWCALFVFLYTYNRIFYSTELLRCIITKVKNNSLNIGHQGNLCIYETDIEISYHLDKSVPYDDTYITRHKSS